MFFLIMFDTFDADTMINLLVSDVVTGLPLFLSLKVLNANVFPLPDIADTDCQVNVGTKFSNTLYKDDSHSELEKCVRLSM